MKYNNPEHYPGSRHISQYRDVMVQQRPEAFKMIESLAVLNADQIVEIGTFHGGLALYLADRNMFDVHTFDIKDHNPSLPKNNRLYRYFMDSFSEECKDFIKTLTAGKRTLWLLDGGNKKKEVEYYTDIIKSGEIVMVHDFAPNGNDFSYLSKNDIWLWHESDDSAFDFELFEKHTQFEAIWKTCAWGVCVKK